MTLSRSINGGLLLFAVLSAVAAPATTDTRSQPAYFAAADLRSEVARPENGMAAFWLPAGIRMKAAVVSRDAIGEAEVHASFEVIYIAQAGEADVLVGGHVEGNHQVSPGEWRGGQIFDGKPYRMKPGDVLWIPPGTPYQVLVPEHGSFQYLGLKVDTTPSK